MELKQAGDLYHMLYVLEQVARSTCRNCDPEVKKMEKGWLHLDQSPSLKSTQPSTKS